MIYVGNNIYILNPVWHLKWRPEYHIVIYHSVSGIRYIILPTDILPISDI